LKESPGRGDLASFKFKLKLVTDWCLEIERCRVRGIISSSLLGLVSSAGGLPRLELESCLAEVGAASSCAITLYSLSFTGFLVTDGCFLSVLSADRAAVVFLDKLTSGCLKKKLLVKEG